MKRSERWSMDRHQTQYILKDLLFGPVHLDDPIERVYPGTNWDSVKVVEATQATDDLEGTTMLEIRLEFPGSYPELEEYGMFRAGRDETIGAHQAYLERIASGERERMG